MTQQQRVDRGWAVVEVCFDEEDTDFEHVPSNWLTEQPTHDGESVKLCRWPDSKAEVRRSKKNRSSPLEKWSSFLVKRVIKFCGKYGSVIPGIRESRQGISVRAGEREQIRIRRLGGCLRD